MLDVAVKSLIDITIKFSLLKSLIDILSLTITIDSSLKYIILNEVIIYKKSFIIKLLI